MPQLRKRLFQTITVPAPAQLMNTAISPQTLELSFARNIENMLPSKGRSRALAKRFGFRKLGNAVGTGTITRLIEHITTAGATQILAYTDNGKIHRYDGPGWTEVRSGLNTSGLLRWAQFNNKVVFCNGFDTPFYWDGTAMTTISEYVTDNGASKTWVAQNQFSLNTGAFGLANYPVSRSIRVTFSTSAHLDLTSLTRSGSTATATTTVNHNLQTGDTVSIADANQSEYNGTFVITVVSPTVFTYTVVGTPATPATGSIKLTFTNVVHTSTVSSRSLSGSILTVTAAANILPDTTVTINKVEYLDSPPAFSFIFAQHDRLWALGPGEARASTFRGPTRMYVYYTDISNSVTGWFNQTTQAVGFINLEGKHGIDDELTGISALDGSMVFFGRTRTQIWAGQDPTDVNDFAWGKNIEIGCVHGDLIQPFPRDVLFFSKYGARSFRTVFQTEQLEAISDLGSNIDPTVQQEVETLLSSDANYKKAASWLYDRDGFYGFKLSTKPLVYNISEQSKGWVIFSGYFSDARAYLGTKDGRLLLARNDQVLVYANGADGLAQAFADDTAAIRTDWWVPWIERRSRWANRYWQLLIEPGSPSMDVQLIRFKDNLSGTATTLTLPINTEQSLWGDADWGVDLWGGTEIARPRLRDKFVAESWSVRIQTNNTVGPFEIVGLNAIGG
ncbi:MAG: hypothetical protein ACK5NY_03470 [Burkholderiaceae bacterium]